MSNRASTHDFARGSMVRVKSTRQDAVVRDVGGLYVAIEADKGDGTTENRIVLADELELVGVPVK